MFKPVSSMLNVNLVEEEVLRFWKAHNIFSKSEELGRGRPEYVFFEGPPTANGKPGVHHVLSRAFKDIFPRYKVMRGFHVSRRGGWDTHGLPVEIEVEKRLGFTHKGQIEEYGIDRFNALCRKSALDYITDWEKLTERIAFWVDLDTAYFTFSRDYIESVWWILKNFWERDLLYQGYKVVPYCPRCGTPLSDHEVAQGYAEAVDPSIFVRLPLVDDKGTSLLIWTTTPWTLPANVAVAVHPEVDYVIVEHDLPEGGTEKLILAKALLEKVFGEDMAHVRVFETFKGRKLKGVRYQPLYTFVPPDKPAHYVVLGDFVTNGDGTGLVHIAPAFGADDMNVSMEYDLPVVMTVADNGAFIDEVRPWRGQFVKDADPEITGDLERRGLLYRSETYTHTYPFCWRCDTPLLYYARSTWYIRTTQFKERLVAINREINWYPEHIKEGRFGNWLANNVDWALGRERYWGTPLPIWECQACRHQVCAGSLAELSDLTGRDLSQLDPHRPFVDEVHFACPVCKEGTMQRVPELIDVWFDSGAMPVAQWHYPFEHEDTFAAQFPADYISEAVDQTRGWFYSLHAISTLLFDKPAFKNVVSAGLILDSDGNKMSKSRGNIVNPWDVLNEAGADAFRWYLYTASPPGQDRRFSVELVSEVVRNFTLTLWNVYSFFVTYANLDGWKPGVGEVKYTDLDRWLLSELHTLVREITQALETYDIQGATRPIQKFVVEMVSQWYLRRSRRRFWKSTADADKNAAYVTLYEVLVTLSKLLAPSMPFIAEELYQNLVVFANEDQEVPESVHLAGWPEADPARIDEALNQAVRIVVRLASLGHAARNTAGIKVRQPLSEMAFSVARREEIDALERFAAVLADELNVKKVSVLGSAGEAVSYSLKPLPKQLGQKYKGLFPKVAQAVLTLDAPTAARALLAGQSVEVMVDGETLFVQPEEVEVRAEALSGLTVAQDGAYLAALHTTLTPALEMEGLAREFVRHVQELRKKSGLDLSDRIHLSVNASPRLSQAIDDFREYILGETLTTTLDGEPSGTAESMHFDGEEAVVSLKKG